jgi:UDP-GlcNAc3NAcA epimerase
MRIMTVVGARPQFVKAAVVSRAIDQWNAAHADAQIDELLIHTGQHFDRNMSQVFFDELGIPAPSANLNAGGGTHGAMTGQMLAGIEARVIADRPDWMLVYGDTNSTLAGALAAAKLHVPIAHVEAGLRSFNRRMPEEINRVVTDHVASLLLCPTQTAVDNLQHEGVTAGVVNVGDVMLDASLHYRQQAIERSTVVERLRLQRGGYVLATCHRAENTDEPERLRAILSALAAVARRMPIVLPLHPRTRNIIAETGMQELLGDITVLDPVSFIDMIRLEEGARTIVTDSGGVQKEAFFFRVPCVTLRDETEWTETVDMGWNRLVGANAAQIVAAVEQAAPPEQWPALYGEGAAGEKIVEALVAHRRDSH